MFLSWTNNSITGDQNAINRRGIQVGIGTLLQIFSLLPTTADRDIYIANKADCAPPPPSLTLMAALEAMVGSMTLVLPPPSARLLSLSGTPHTNLT